MMGKVYPGILVDIINLMTKGLIDDEQGGFRSGMGCVDQIFTLKQLRRKHTRRNKRYCICRFYKLGEGV